MAGIVKSLLRDIAPPEQAFAYHVACLPNSAAYYVGRDGHGNAAVLVRATGEGRFTPLRLAGIEVRFSVPCLVSEIGAIQRTETLSAIVCVSREKGIETLFANIMESLVALMGDAPSVSAVDSAVEQLVELFQKLRRPAQRSLIGLIGELCIICAARNCAAAAAAWRIDVDERFDFVVGNLRVDAKASPSGRTTHPVSFEQANPPPGTYGLLATVGVDAAGGGTSLLELISAIEARLAPDHGAVGRLWSVVGATLGETLPTALDWRFDLKSMEASLAFYDAMTIPSIRPPLPIGLSGIRFVSDFGEASAINLANWSTRLTDLETQILPANH